MADLNLIVEPPARPGSRKSNVDPELLAAMTAQFSADRWIGDGKTYKTAKDASTALGQYRRAIATSANVAPHTIKSRVWGEDSKGNPLTDRDKPGVWKVALQHDPNRTPRARNTNGATPDASPAPTT